MGIERNLGLRFLGGLVSAMLLLTLTAVPAAGQDLKGYVSVEYRGFLEQSPFEGPGRQNLSLVIEPDLYWEWGRSADLVFVPFVRLDQSDAERTHFDVRELLYRRRGPSWELRAGIGQVFWGVTESQHLVDIINQTDLVENIDGEDNLGQPMVNLSLIRSWGILDVFVLPGFRKRTFPGTDGRFRTAIPVDTSQSRFESDLEERHVDFAVRWFHSLGDWDIGLSHFYGTNREPRFEPGTDRDGRAVLVPVYDLINQTSLDLQLTRGGWLWKLEAMRRSGQGPRFGALTGGFEHTWSNLRNSGKDIGFLVEYLYDSRGRRATSSFENDIFVGTRVALNDTQSTELLVGAILDHRTGASLINLEGSRRIGDRWKATLEIRSFVGVPVTDSTLASFRDDDYAQLELSCTSESTPRIAADSPETRWS